MERTCTVNRGNMTGAQTNGSPTEETPLVADSCDEGNNRPGSEAAVGLGRGLAITVFMGMLIFIQATNISMLTTTQSDIAADLDAFAEATWFSAVYLIAMSCMTPLAGRLSAIFTPRIYVLFSCALLSVGLFITAAARTLAGFLSGRAIAGTGSGGLLSTSIILVLDLASKKRRGLCIGMINAGFTTGVASGAILAGIVSPLFGWRIIYWIQAFAACVLGPLLFLAIPRQWPSDSVPESEEHSILQKLARVDYAGSLALTGSLVLLLYSLASSTVSLLLIALAIVVFSIFVLIETRFTFEPIIPVAVLSSRSVLLTCASSLTIMMARWAVLFFTPVYAMAVRGWSPASAGLILLPTNFGFGLGGLLVGWMHIRRAESYYFSCLVACVFFVAAILGLSLLSTPTSPVSLYLFATFFNGLCAGALLNYTLSHLLHMTVPEVHYMASSLVGMSRGFAGSFGSAVGGGFFSRVLKESLERGFRAHGLQRNEELIQRLLGSPALVMSLRGADRRVAVQSYQHATRMLFLVGGLVALLATVLQAGTGWKGPGANMKGEEEDSDDQGEGGLD